MQENTAKWLHKAEADFRSMEWEMKQPTQPNFDAICFFAQQCVEKWLKVLCVEQNIAFPKTHDLEKLLNLLLRIYPQFGDLSQSLGRLSNLSSDVRYPNEFATASDAKESIDICKDVRTLLRTTLGTTPLFP